MKNAPGYGKTLQNGLCTKQSLNLVGFKKDSFLICINRLIFLCPHHLVGLTCPGSIKLLHEKTCFLHIQKKKQRRR